jgi:uncharacterized 2Fe-2S/4Fe-4S cluster protein (DUF4445 family)
MATLRVRVDGKVHALAFDPAAGASLRGILEPTEYRVRTACLGLGACGLCRVRVLQGNAGAITAVERAQLDEPLLVGGIRLACQCYPADDLELEVLSLAAPTSWRMPVGGLKGFGPLRWVPSPPSRHSGARPLGVAVDLGTSHISVAVLDLDSGRPLTLRLGPNPQRSYGADIMTRLVVAGDPVRAETLAGLARTAIGEALAEVARSEGIDLARVVRMAVVGNTAMLSLLVNRNHQQLLEPRNWFAPVECAPLETDAWAQDWGLSPVVSIDVIPPLAGFVGSDLLAGVVAERMLERPAPCLLIDFGTNSEMALWAGGALWVTATAGGPAFEASAGRDCIPAEAGAVCHVREGAGEALECDIVGSDEARGLCGSGLVDLLACLLRRGKINAIGRFKDGSERFHFNANGRMLSLGWREIDALQRAKAAIGAGVAVLCECADVDPAKLRQVLAAGLFGRHLDLDNAAQIGLLPTLPAGRISLVGNTALAGACALLFAEGARRMLADARGCIRFVNLGNTAAFDAVFLDHLFLQPMSSSP